MTKRTESASDISIQVGKMKKEASTLENAYSILAETVRSDVDKIARDKRLILESVIKTVINEKSDAERVPFLRKVFPTVERLIAKDETIRAKRKADDAKKEILITKKTQMEQAAQTKKESKLQEFKAKESQIETLKPTALFEETYAAVANAINSSSMYEMSLDDIIANPQSYKKGMSVKYALSKSYRDVVNAIDTFESRTGRSFVVSMSDADTYIAKKKELIVEQSAINSEYSKDMIGVNAIKDQIADLGRPHPGENNLLPTRQSELIDMLVTTAAVEWSEHLNAFSSVKNKVTSIKSNTIFKELEQSLKPNSEALVNIDTKDEEFAILSAKRLVLVQELENIENVASNVKSIKKTFSNQQDKLDKLARGRGRARLSWDKEKVKSDWATYQTALTGQLRSRKEQHSHISNNFNRNTLYGSPVYSSYNSSYNSLHNSSNNDSTNWLLIWMLYNNSICNVAYADSMDINQLNNLSTTEVLSALPDVQPFDMSSISNSVSDSISSASEGFSSTNFDIDSLTSSFNDVLSDAYSTSSGSSISLDSYSPSSYDSGSSSSYDSGSSSSWSSSSDSSSSWSSSDSSSSSSFGSD